MTIATQEVPSPVSYGLASLRPAGPHGLVPAEVDRGAVLEADDVSLAPSVANDFRHTERLPHSLPARVICWRCQAVVTHTHLQLVPRLGPMGRQRVKTQLTEKMPCHPCLPATAWAEGGQFNGSPSLPLRGRPSVRPAWRMSQSPGLVNR